MNDTIIIRAEFSHADAISNIENQCFSVPWSKNSVEEFLANPLSVCFVAVCDGTVAGYIGMYNICGNADITNVAVLPHFRRCGIASQLVDAVVEYCTKNNLNEIALEVRESNIPAASLYKKHGFVAVGIRKNYYTKPKENAVLMTKFIES